VPTLLVLELIRADAHIQTRVTALRQNSTDGADVFLEMSSASHSDALQEATLDVGGASVKVGVLVQLECSICDWYGIVFNRPFSNPRPELYEYNVM
jgi:hypothetical protein